MSIYKILVIQPLRPEALAIFEGRADITYDVVTDFSPENLLPRIVTADAVTVRDAPLPADVLAAGPGVKVVSRHGVGVDNIPVDYCTGRGIPVTIVGPVNAISVAEQTMFLMLTAARSGIELDHAVRQGDFAARSRVLGAQLHGRTLCVVGLGRVGHEVALRARAFGMKVVAFDPYAGPAVSEGVRLFETLEAALEVADVVSLHLPLADDTRNLLGARQLDLLPEGAIVINAARGGLIDEDALAERVGSGRLFGAGLDTFAEEPLPVDSPLLADRKIAVSPHSAALTKESLTAMGVMTARNALAGLDGTLDPDLVVNKSVLRDGKGD